MQISQIITDSTTLNFLCLHKLFEAQVKRTPDNIAVVFENQQLTYAQLNARVNQLAHHLESLGVGPDLLVGIYVERSLEMVIGLLGILKAGGAFLPLDPAYPQERLAFILQEARILVLLTQQRLVKSLPKQEVHIICLDTGWEVIEQESEENLTSGVTTDNLAYVMYTSGSTGQPKGVMIPHCGISNRLLWGQATHPLTEEDRVLQAGSLSADGSVWEIFAPLVAGAQLIVARPGVYQDLAYLSQLIVERRITILHFVTSMLQVFLSQETHQSYDLVRHVFCGGEILPVELQKRFFTRLRAQLHNQYGPTEASVHVTSWTCQRESYQTTVPIGRPIANTQIYLLDSELKPVPIGGSGELYIGGIGLARGYLNQPELTAETFIPNPFSKDPSSRIFKTGDLARYLPDGTLEFLGRLDSQVKIHGYRIELGEVEAVLGQQPGVQETAVIAREEIGGNKRLVAYFVPWQETATTVNELLGFLKQKLPDYMLPSAFVRMDAMPRMPNGKVNRKALPAPAVVHLELSVPFVAPRTPVEEVVAGLWGQLLGLEQLGIRDNFFELGGNSLLATQLISRLRQTFQVELGLLSIFECPTVAELATLIEEKQYGKQPLPFKCIEPISRNAALPLSFPQERIWFLQQLYPSNIAYNYQATLRFTGSLNVAALEQSLSSLVRRHEIYRTTVRVVDGQPFQNIHQPQPVHLPIVDLQAVPEGEQEAEVQRLLWEEFRKPFNMAQLPLIRWTLLRLSEREHLLVHVEHHLVHDGWSVNVFLCELQELYRAFSTGNASLLSELPIQFADFAYWQRQWLQGEVAKRQLDYWKAKLASIPPLLELPYDRPRPAVESFRGAQQRIDLSASLYESLRTLSRQNEVTLFMTLLAAFQVLLNRYSGQEDICVGSGIANRRWRETEGLIGMLLNALVLRTDLSGNPTFRELLARVRKVALEAYAHQDVPFVQVVEAVQPTRHQSHNPLFQVAFSFQDTPLPNLQFPELSVSLERLLCNGTSKFDLDIVVFPRSEQRVGLSPETGASELMMVWKYNTDLFDRATIARMVAHYQTLLEGIVAAPNEQIGALPLLTAAEQHQILVQWNDTNRDYTQEQSINGVHELFEAQVAQSPNAIAVIFEDKQLTYRELNQQANQLAHRLQSLGVGPEVLVGICLERSLEMVVGLLGILKAGAAYVPLDPAYPQEHLDLMLDNAKVFVLLTQERLLEKVTGHGATTVLLDSEWESIAHESEENPASGLTDENLAYAIYTSGSTGKPRGVAIQHRSLVNYTLTAGVEFRMKPGDRVLQFASISFDTAAEEIFPCLARGATLVLRTASMVNSLSTFLQKCSELEITVLDLPTAYWHQLAFELSALDLKLPKQLRLVILGGEKVLMKPLAIWHKQVGKRVRLVNTYGPTEATIVATMYELSEVELDRQEVPIGKTISNCQTYVLDRNLQPVPIGIPGELYIGGYGLARGYLNQPALTTEKFISNPFSNSPGSRLYKTGDQVRYLPDGNLEFLGRLDSQVKIRGFRIELGEVEATLNRHSAVRETAVTLREDVPGDKRLVAYVVARAEQKPTSDQLRLFLKQKLPEYMMPSAFVTLEALPLLPNGKVDRRSLPAPAQTSPERAESFAGPRNSIEAEVASIWAKVLRQEQVGLHDNFFDLGGHSLLATQILSMLYKKFQVQLPPNCLFEAPTVEGLSRMLQHIMQHDGAKDTR